MSRNSGRSIPSSAAPTSRRNQILPYTFWVAGQHTQAGVFVTPNSTDFYLCLADNHDSALTTANWQRLFTEAFLDGRYAPISVTGGGAASLTPTAIKTAAYTAAVGDNVLVNATSAVIPITLPSGAADKSQVGVKPVALTVPNYVNLLTQGSDRFNIAGGVATLPIKTLNEEMVVQYQLSSGLWIVIDNDLDRPTQDMVFTYTGPLVVSVGQSPWPAPCDGFITGVQVNLGTAPTVNAMVFDFDKNGTTIFTTQANRPQVAVSSKASGVVSNMDVGYMQKGDLISFDIDVKDAGGAANATGTLTYHPAT